MSYIYWTAVLGLTSLSYFFPQFILPVFLVLSAGYLRWLNVWIVSIVKIHKDEKEQIIKSINDCIGMINNQTAIIKRLNLMERDVDGIERELQKHQREISQVKRTEQTKNKK